MRYPAPELPLTATPRNEVLVRSFTRAGAALVEAKGNKQQAARLVSDDRGAVEIINRTATMPASTSLTTFKQTTIAFMASILTGATAFGAIIERATQLTFGHGGALWVPGLAADATGVGYILEGNAIPVSQYDVSAGCMIVPQKLGFTIVISDELLRYSNFESVMRRLVAAKLQIGGETIMLDATAGTSTRPAGLRYNIAAETASSTATIEGMVADLGLITSKVAGISGLADVIVVASPKQAVKIWAQLPLLRIPVFASAALADGVVMAIACSGIAVAGSPDMPRIELSDTGVFHMDGAAGPLSSDSAVVAYPIRSLYQTATSALRVICDFTFAPRASSGVVSWIENVKW
jgi:hypothetical protein